MQLRKVIDVNARTGVLSLGGFMDNDSASCFLEREMPIYLSRCPAFVDGRRLAYACNFRDGFTDLLLLQPLLLLLLLLLRKRGAESRHRTKRMFLPFARYLFRGE